jgi:hypothetical protein
MPSSHTQPGRTIQMSRSLILCPIRTRRLSRIRFRNGRLSFEGLDMLRMGRKDAAIAAFPSGRMMKNGLLTRAAQ